MSMPVRVPMPMPVPVPTPHLRARRWGVRVPMPVRVSIPLLVFTLVVVVLSVHTEQARAVILPASTIDGPNENIVGFGGVAMAEDGTGGLVYLKRVNGIPHVFVSPYAEGHWLAPIQVDLCRVTSSTGEGEHCEEPFAASWPRIGAANGGELVVVWATPFATENSRPVDELLGATLGPGSSKFSPAILIDPDIEDGTGTSPDLAMSSTVRSMSSTGSSTRI